jgi:hypothetical protein
VTTSPQESAEHVHIAGCNGPCPRHPTRHMPGLVGEVACRQAPFPPAPGSGGRAAPLARKHGEGQAGTNLPPPSPAPRSRAPGCCLGDPSGPIRPSRCSCRAMSCSSRSDRDAGAEADLNLNLVDLTSGNGRRRSSFSTLIFSDCFHLHESQMLRCHCLRSQ